jgi:hypothetical protein
MKTESTKSLKIELEGDEVETFKSAIKKITAETGKAGFTKNSDLDAEEISMIRAINDKIIQ